MDFLELAKNRYSCRSFLEKPIEQEKINLILEAARLSPTAANFQPQRILVLTDKEKLSKLSECTKYGWNAPLVLIVCYDKNISWKRKYDGNDEGTVDASIITTHMMLEVTSLGLGSTWVGSFNPQKVRSIYNIPENYEIISILPIGYPSNDAEPSSSHEIREPIENIAFYNEF